jgi:hypothetical protein
MIRVTSGWASSASIVGMPIPPVGPVMAMRSDMPCAFPVRGSAKPDYDAGFHQGDTAQGTVEEKVRASEDDPQYRVRSDKSGNDAVHKPAPLKKQSEKVMADEDAEHQRAWQDFGDAINMAASQLNN